MFGDGVFGNINQKNYWIVVDLVFMFLNLEVCIECIIFVWVFLLVKIQNIKLFMFVIYNLVFFDVCLFYFIEL